MKSDALSKFFPVFVLAAAAFVWLSGQSMPAVVASHFGASGQADAFAPREGYVRFMTALVLLLPVLVVYLPNWLLARVGFAVNLPNKRYWMAPERREETLAYLRGNAFRLGYLLVGLLAYVHWLVVRANAAVPPALDAAWLVGGLVAFVVGAGACVLALVRRFARVPG
ncbi:MAG: DUF1648 domain-containing protein [Mizugakiibacter sp.]|uniref:DUF1648 domain-containing protein n=1 Tax=Mizugakiibacter sp. TaxID=1972610 RepID=UPI0031C0F533|nr:DUF1648 domain-containing protein [Xanthomonadaceae bacterium]